MYTTLMFSTGASKGMMFFGAVRQLVEAKKIDISKVETFCGVSAGSIVAFFLILGYSFEEIEEFVTNFDYNLLEVDVNIDVLFENFGLDEGEKLTHVFKHFAKEKFGKDDITFKELYEVHKKKLVIQATNLTRSTLDTFCWKTTPEMPIVLAIRMSISLPFIFTPVKYQNNLYVDPGLNISVPTISSDLLKLQDIECSNILFFEVEYEEKIYSEINDFPKYMEVIFRSYLYYRKSTTTNCKVITLKSTCESVFPTKEEVKQLIKDGYEQCLLQNDFI